jgi:hypothetical protein
MVRDPYSGRYRRTRMFVRPLGYSRNAVHLLTFQSSTRIWAELHEQAFRRLRSLLPGLGPMFPVMEVYLPPVETAPERVRFPDNRVSLFQVVHGRDEGFAPKVAP